MYSFKHFLVSKNICCQQAPWSIHVIQMIQIWNSYTAHLSQLLTLWDWYSGDPYKRAYWLFCSAVKAGQCTVLQHYNECWLQWFLNKKLLSDSIFFRWSNKSSLKEEKYGSFSLSCFHCGIRMGYHHKHPIDGRSKRKIHHTSPLSAALAIIKAGRSAVTG